MIGTYVVLVVFFVVDLFVLGRRPHVPSTKECVQHIAFSSPWRSSSAD